MSGLFLRQIQHLLPDSQAWRITVQKTLRLFFEGLTGLPSDARDYIDGVWGDLFPDTTRELAEWEKQFGLTPNADESVRRLALAAEWAATGGQSPDYIQGVLQTAGFDVYVHEWWSSGPPYVARDPRDYTDQPRVGTSQCSAFPSQPTCRPRRFASQPRCNRFLVNDPHYFANKNLTRQAPPPVPSDSTKWPYFLYVGGETFPNNAIVDTARRDELERLIQKLKPAQQWIVTLIVYEDTYTSRDEADTYVTRGGTDAYVTGS